MHENYILYFKYPDILLNRSMKSQIYNSVNFHSIITLASTLFGVMTRLYDNIKYILTNLYIVILEY